MTSPRQDGLPLSALARAVLSDLAGCPTPYHAVERSTRLLSDAGFGLLRLDEPFPTEPGPYMVSVGGSIVAWVQRPEHSGFTVVGAHTDSPNLRVKTNPDVTSAGYRQIGVEIYGGVLLNSWLDRGLGLAGRVSLIDRSGGVQERLMLDDRPLLLIPQLAIHLDRQVVSSGLKLDPQSHMTPLWALDRSTRTPDGDETTPGPGPAPTGETTAAPGEAGAGPSGGAGAASARDDAEGLRAHIARWFEVPTDRVLAWDLMTFDVQPPAVVGRDGDLFSSGRIDNLLSAFCGVRAMADLAVERADSGTIGEADRTPVLALYDHEEVGSESATGAAGVFLAAVLERIALAEGADRSGYLAGLNRSIVVSADGAHATHPNYVDRHEPSHRIELNAGVVIKRNANQRYATDAASEAFIIDVCRTADVPLQYYIHRNDLPCGSTIGPLTAARLGVPTVDIGAPQLAMHSARETAGVHDIAHLGSALITAWRHPGLNREPTPVDDG